MEAVMEAHESSLSEILKKIRRIEIITRRLVSDVFSGEYHSVFKGQGMEFEEVREYQPGDDVRAIDWNVTARMGSPFVKRYVEERELLVLFLLDVSASERFGSAGSTKMETAAEICALLAFSAIENNDKVGAIMFSDDVEEYLPPDKGRKHVLHVVRKLLFYEPKRTKTDIGTALRYLMRVVKRRAIVFVLSDFIAPDFSREIAMAARKFDVVAIRLGDAREETLPQGRLLRVWDQEEGVERVIDLSRRRAREAFSRMASERDERLLALFRRSGVDVIRIRTGEDYIKPLSVFFRARAKRR
jgi:uncharacterized protein (DUF58 family)